MSVEAAPFEAVPYDIAVRSARTLFDQSLDVVARWFDNNDVNTGYLNHVIPETLYRAIIRRQKERVNLLSLHDWSVCSNVPIEIFLHLMNYDMDDGIPGFAYEVNLLKLEYVIWDYPDLPHRRYCLPCYNSFMRLNLPHPHNTMTLCQERIYAFGDELIDTIQYEGYWCHRCYSKPLFVIKEASESEILEGWPYNTGRIYQRPLMRCS